MLTNDIFSFDQLGPGFHNHSSGKGSFFLNLKVGIFFLFLHGNPYCGYSLQAACWRASNQYPQHRFPWRNKKYYLDTPSCLWLWWLTYVFSKPQNETYKLRFVAKLAYLQPSYKWKASTQKLWASWPSPSDISQKNTFFFILFFFFLSGVLFRRHKLASFCFEYKISCHKRLANLLAFYLMFKKIWTLVITLNKTAINSANVSG